MPSVVDPTRGAAGQAPDVDVRAVRAVQAARGRPGTTCARPFADRCFDLLDEYAPNFKRSVLARQVLTPLDLERDVRPDRRQHLPGRDDAEPALRVPAGAGLRGYRTPIRGLYLCGAAAHPGGGVMGAPGCNAAREILGAAPARVGVNNLA